MQQTNLKKSTIIKLLLLLLIPFSLLLNRSYQEFPEWWEKYYSLGINKFIIKILSYSVGFFPFSVFEVLVFLFAIFFVGYLLYTIYNIIKNYKIFYIILGRYLLNIAVIIAVLFSSFELLWGLNYKRPQFGVAEGLEIAEYTTDELGQLYSYLLETADGIREKLPENDEGVVEMFGDYKDIFNRAQLGYDTLSSEFISLAGNYGNVKPFMISPLLNYTSITGMYSPFTGEPNVNVAIPSMYIPSTTCHEMAHQRGYGFEDQCNFIAFITCANHPDLDFQYSGYLLSIAYVSNALASSNFELLANINNNVMSDSIRRDLDYGNAFWDQFEGEVEVVADNINNAFLKSNGVQAGTQSYGKVVDLLLAYYSKYYA
ncbi:MAG: hypothetical protein BEN19_08575 [Epulopiscium sp. Nuni2H_MBin003]|nr:MAG: hypothetical protein BEN19_08575 [Epulopiscium sp. Nuni2H_MBin003]